MAWRPGIAAGLSYTDLLQVWRAKRLSRSFSHSLGYFVGCVKAHPIVAKQLVML